MNRKTKIVSFRVLEELFEKIEEVAKEEEKERADLVKELFVPAFEQKLQERESSECAN